MSSLIPVISIESGHVIAALVRVSGASLPEIIFLHQEYFPLQDEVVSERLEDAAIKSLSLCLKALHSFSLEKKLSHVKEPAVILGAPWYNAETKNIKNINRTPILVKESLIDEFVKQEVEKIAAEKGIGANGSSLIDKKISAISLNGYPTTKPFGKKALTVEFNLFLSVVPTSFKEKVKEALRTSLPFKHIMWETLSMVLFTGLSNIIPEKKELLIVDLGAELAEISLVKEGTLQEAVTFPFGTNTIVRSMAKGLKVTPQIAHSLLELYQNGKMEQSSVETAADTLKEIEGTWKELFTQALTSLARGRAMPTSLYLFTGAEFLKLSKDFILKEEFIQSMLPGGHFEVVSADTLDLHKLVTVPMHARKSSTFQLSTLFVSWLLSQKEM